MKPRFEGTIGGFDKLAVPKWQIIGKGDLAVVWLYDANDAEVKILAPGIAKLEEMTVGAQKDRFGRLTPPPENINFRIFRLKGLMVGKTFVEVRKNGKLLERLEVQIVDLIEFTVTFNYVSDNAGHRTARNSADLDDIILSANLVLQNQAVIKIIKHNVRQVQFNRDLGRVVLAQNVWDIIASKRDKSAIFNTFWVWIYEQDDTPDEDGAEGAAANRVCLIEDDQSTPVSETLIHELGHLMTLPHYSKEDYFMNDVGTNEIWFRKNQILAMRRGLKHIMKLAR